MLMVRNILTFWLILMSTFSKEPRFLQSFESFRADVESMFDILERTLSNLFGLLQHNGGRLSTRACDNELSELPQMKSRKVTSTLSTTVNYYRW